MKCIGLKFVNNNNGTVTDTETDLMWMTFNVGQQFDNVVVGETVKMNWFSAMKIPVDLNKQGGYAGFTDWRLPKCSELEDLIESIDYNHPILFPDKNGHFWFWTSKPIYDDPNVVKRIAFKKGMCEYGWKEDDQSAVRLVRNLTHKELPIPKDDEIAVMNGDAVVGVTCPHCGGKLTH